MKRFQSIAALSVAGALFLTLPALGGPQAKTYQVTGPVLELTDTTIVVQKGEEKWRKSCWLFPPVSAAGVAPFFWPDARGSLGYERTGAQSQRK